jgi:succinate dehydrogenase / fumarate reductase, cytochrome b subunit
MERPLSPFMFPIWYRFQITSALSILHRLTGIALAVGSILLVWWIAFFYHLCNGVRHLAWDAGYGFELESAARSGYAVLAATVLLTALTWLYVFLA